MPEEIKVPAWDLKDLEEKLKSHGMPIVEGAAIAFFNSICEWAEYGIKNDENKTNDLALAVLPPFKAFVISKLEGISK